MTCPAAFALAFLVASSHHVPGDYNERHEGFGLEWPASCRTSLVLGHYRNSHNRSTTYAGAAWEYSLTPRLHAGGTATLVTGYEETPIMAAVTLRLDAGPASVRILHVPATVTAVQTVWRFP